MIRQKRRIIYLEKLLNSYQNVSVQEIAIINQKLLQKNIRLVRSNQNGRKYDCIFSESDETTTVSSLSNHSSDISFR
jgi:hypothetical protein